MIRLLTVSTNNKVEFQNITRAVQETVDSIRVESREYEVQDGDVVCVLFNK